MAASTVTKKDFADALAKEHHLTKKQGREMLEDLIGLITQHLKKGERVKTGRAWKRSPSSRSRFAKACVPFQRSANLWSWA